MKVKLCALFLVLLLVSACAGEPSPQPSPVVPVATSSPVVTNTLVPTVAPTGTAMPTAADTPAQPTMLPTASPSPEAAQSPTPTDEVEYRESCISIEESIPPDLKLSGAIVLRPDKRTEKNGYGIFHLDLMSRRKSPIPASAISLSLSPDGKWLAYLEIVKSENGDEQQRILKVVNAEGRYLDLSGWLIDWQWLYGWVDAQRLMIHAPGNRSGDLLVLDPFRMQKEVWGSDLSGLLWQAYVFTPAKALPNADLSRWVIEGPEWKWQMLASEGWNVLWEGENGYDNEPRWSPDGHHFAIMGDFAEHARLLLVDEAGRSKPLTQRVGPREQVAWSPDSRRLAGWLQLDLEAPLTHESNHLVLIDVEPPLLHDLCFQNELEPDLFGTRYNTRPAWSPDGRYLAISVTRLEKRGDQTDTLYDTAVIDLQARKGYLLVENAIPVAWMRR